MAQIRKMWISRRGPRWWDPISHTQEDRRADKIQGAEAGTLKDDERRGGEWEQFTGNHILISLECLEWRRGLCTRRPHVFALPAEKVMDA